MLLFFQCTETGSVELEDLKENLSLIKKMGEDPSAPKLDGSIQFEIKKYINARLRDDMEINDIETEMRKLCYEHLVIPTSLCEWTIGIVKELSRKFSAQSQPSSPNSSSHISPYNTESKPPERLGITEFKEMLYHALLCCQAVNTCTSSDYSSVFSSLDNGNKFSEVSISICSDHNIDRYIIAKQKDVVYLAFLSEPFISNWLDKYPSFIDGLQQQTNRFPMKYLEEQILAHKKIVLTGKIY